MQYVADIINNSLTGYAQRQFFFYNEYNAREGDNYQVARIVNYAILIKQMQGSKTSSAKRLPDIHMLLITDPLIFIGSINSCGIKDYNRVLYLCGLDLYWPVYSVKKIV